jgi:hypothetical protein
MAKKKIDKPLYYIHLYECTLQGFAETRTSNLCSILTCITCWANSYGDLIPSRSCHVLNLLMINQIFFSVIVINNHSHILKLQSYDCYYHVSMLISSWCLCVYMTDRINIPRITEKSNFKFLNSYGDLIPSRSCHVLNLLMINQIFFSVIDISRCLNTCLCFFI